MTIPEPGSELEMRGIGGDMMQATVLAELCSDPVRLLVSWWMPHTEQYLRMIAWHQYGHWTARLTDAQVAASDAALEGYQVDADREEEGDEFPGLLYQHRSPDEVEAMSGVVADVLELTQEPV